jgi:ABC-type polysaccharide/polyol phosphate export permease
MLANLAALWRYRDLVRNLAARDLRVKYKGSALGFAWSLAQPLLMAGVYTAAFTWILRVGIEHYPLFILSGMLPWTWFAQSLSLATGTIADHGTLVRKVAFPRMALPAGALASQALQFALMYAVIVGAGSTLVLGPSPAMLAVIPVALVQLAFTTGLALMLSTAYVYFRDTRHLIDVLLQVWFWATPVVYTIDAVPPQLRVWLSLNPMTHIVTAYHQAALAHVWPSPESMLALSAVAAATLATGVAVFTTFERRFGELV